MKTSRTKTKLWISLLIVLGSILISVFLSYSTLFKTLELKLLDLNFAIRGPVSVEDSPIVIVAIDDQSDEATPHRWPWPRYYYAHIIENLEEAGAAVIGIDVILDQPDKYGQGSDDTLAAVLEQYDNILLTGKIMRTEHDWSYSTLYPPYEKFLTGNTTWGLAPIEADLDGFYRKYLVGQAHFDSLYPSFAAEVLKIYKKLPKDTPVLEDDDYYYLGTDTIPKINNSGMLINYVGPARSFTYYSFSQILDDMDFDLVFEHDMDAFDDPGDEELGIPPGLLASGLLKDKIVLIGSTMQELHDNFPTPFLEYRTGEGVKAKAETPGVEIHANALHTILTKNYVKQIPEFYLYLIILIFAAIVIMITRYLPTLWSVAIAVILIVAYFVFTVYEFISNGLLITFSTPFLVVVLIYISETIYHFLMTQKEKKVIRGAFAHYVPEKIVQEIIANPDKLSLGGEERIVSVLFSDVVSFTSISEELSPRNLVLLLNEYLTEMSEIIHQFNGVIDKFEGDAIMAEFGVPVSYPDHAKAACNCAIEMQEKLNTMRAHWIKEGKPPLSARIGINTGEVIVGNMGSRHLFDYTVMGDHVNLGARLESANKSYGTKIMISEFTHNDLDEEFFTRPLDFIRVQGKTKPVEVFELLGNKKTPFNDSYLEMLENYHKGYLAYRRRDWDEAIQIFEKCKELEPKDQPSKIYFERCVDFKYNSPPKDWDGVIELKEK
jgi:adenylate cyclase